MEPGRVHPTPVSSAVRQRPSSTAVTPPYPRSSSQVSPNSAAPPARHVPVSYLPRPCSPWRSIQLPRIHQHGHERCWRSVAHPWPDHSSPPTALRPQGVGRGPLQGQDHCTDRYGRVWRVLLRASRGLYVLRRWQFAHTTWHFAISVSKAMTVADPIISETFPAFASADVIEVHHTARLPTIAVSARHALRLLDDATVALTSGALVCERTCSMCRARLRWYHSCWYRALQTRQWGWHASEPLSQKRAVFCDIDPRSRRRITWW